MADLAAQGPIAAGSATSVAVDTSVSPHQPGSRMRDANGNEYIWVDFTGTVSAEQPVAIVADRTAGPLGTSGRGPVGIAQGSGTSNQTGWVQIYGRAFVMLGMSGVSPSDAANGPTTAETSGQTVFSLATSLTSPNGIGWTSGPAQTLTSSIVHVIEGITVAQDVSLGDVSATTSATTHTGNRVAVWLNYPYIRASEITT